MLLNGLLGSPAPERWGAGQPVDVPALLGAPDGRARASVLYLEHLTESERQVVFTHVLSKVVSWVRHQPDSSALRALVYADDAFWLAPAHGDSPSRPPLLRLLHEAGARGVGVVLATRRPTDLDPEVRRHAGTWLVGRWDGERDRALVASRMGEAEVRPQTWDRRLASLPDRRFVVGGGSTAPMVLSTRWTMSYLRAPLSREEVARLAPPGGYEDESRPAGERRVRRFRPLAPDESPVAPRVAGGIRVAHVDPRAPWLARPGAPNDALRLEPGASFRTELVLERGPTGGSQVEESETVLFPLRPGARPADALAVDRDPRDLRPEEPTGAHYVVPDAELSTAAFYARLRREVEDHLRTTLGEHLLHNRRLGLLSRAAESRSEFAARCLTAAEDRADREAARLRARCEARLRALRPATSSTTGGSAADVLGHFLGGRRRVRRLSSVAPPVLPGAGGGPPTAGESEPRPERAPASPVGIQQELTDELLAIWVKWQDAAHAIESVEVGPADVEIRVHEPIVFWAPAPGRSGSKNPYDGREREE